MQLESVKSIIRYTPPKGTAGFALSFVRGKSLSPLPPAIINVKTLSTFILQTGIYYTTNLEEMQTTIKQARIIYSS
jgi:hypothetical protein